MKISNPHTPFDRGVDATKAENNMPRQNLSYYVTAPSTKAKLPSNIVSWTIDSGATYHMTNALSSLIDKIRCEEIIQFADGGTVTATYKGTYVGYINNNEITLRNVLYIPKFKRSLLSIDNLSEEGYKTIFYNFNNKNLVTIYNKEGKRIFTTKSNKSKIYKVWTFKNKIEYNRDNNKKTITCDNIIKAFNTENMELWHRRLGHFYIDNIKEKLNNINIQNKCIICASKMRNKPYNKARNKSKEPFELIHMDTVSSLDSSIYGNKYFLSILDDYTRYGWVFFMNSKAEVFNIFRKWYKKVTNIFNKNIKYIRTDNGTEFTNNNFRKFCEENGIEQQFSIPYNPQQNGRAERFQETLIYNATAMLKDGKLNHKYWEDAVRTANYIHNRLPHNGNNNKVPFEELYQEKVDYEKFRVFGCQVYFYIPKQFRRKFNGTSLPGIFLGYDDKNPTAYIIYDTTNNKIVLSRTVEFFEDTPGNISAPSTRPEIYNFEVNMEEYDENNKNTVLLQDYNNKNKEHENKETTENREENKNNNNINNNDNLNNLNNNYLENNNLNNNNNINNNYPNDNNLNKYNFNKNYLNDNNINFTYSPNPNKNFPQSTNIIDPYKNYNNYNILPLNNLNSNISSNLPFAENLNPAIYNYNAGFINPNLNYLNKNNYIQNENYNNFLNEYKGHLYLNDNNLNNNYINKIINYENNAQNSSNSGNLNNKNSEDNSQGKYNLINNINNKNDKMEQSIHNSNCNDNVMNGNSSSIDNNYVKNNYIPNNNLYKNNFNTKMRINNLYDGQSNMNDVQRINNNSNINKELNSNINNELNSNINKGLISNINNELNSNINKELNSNIKNELNSNVSKELNSNVNKELKSKVNKELNSNIKNELNSNVNKELNSNVNKELNSNVNKELNSNENKELNSNENKELNKLDMNNKSNNSTISNINNDKETPDKTNNKKTSKRKGKRKLDSETKPESKKLKSSNLKDKNVKRKGKRKLDSELKPESKKIKSFDLMDIIEDNFSLLSTKEELCEPYNYPDIFNKIDKNEWLQAVKEELNSMKNLKVYKKVDRVPKGSNIITPKWVFRYKYNSDNSINKRKARLVARGFTQKQGIDYNETFSPTLKQDSLRIATAIASANNFNIYQIDIKSAYLNATLNEDVYMEIPEGAEDYKNGYWKLNKALYGLKQSGRLWNETLNEKLINIGFNRLRSEPCIYVKMNDRNKIICLLTVYVDDILLTGNEHEVYKTKHLLKNYFNITDIGPVDTIIGVKFIKEKDGYLLQQHKYLENILRKFDIDKYKISSNMIPEENEELRKRKFNITKYQQAIGSLLYLAICTRPDILFPVNKASRKAKDPNYEDWYNVIKIFRYLKGKPNYGLRYSGNLKLNVYVDADYGGDVESRKSTTGYIIKIGSGPTSWYSKLQHCVSVSSAESEYYGINECARHCLWYENVLNELKLNCNCITINVDNKAAIYNCENETINPRSRHIDIKYHHTRDLIKENKIKLKYIKSEDNLADGFTKYLNTYLLNKFRDSIMVKC